ncbi:adenylate/guanylate cyclase domain-containing protein [Nocardioides panaciterrulae]|uniref:Adenylate cyclase n=1 Tax=Nocardioides panaciterrulae TaxID=661492 RepID=A0A7Y9EA79_9ACTN|nr:adenylate cyclase [Nocardioides panaciterrulae]
MNPRAAEGDGRFGDVPSDVYGRGASDGPGGADQPVELPDLADALVVVEDFLLGDQPSLTRLQVAERAGVSLAVAEQMWRLLGFPNQDDDSVAFTPADVEALRLAQDLTELGILGPDSQAALVRTWGRSFARLAEWQTSLLADVAVEGPDPQQRLTELAGSVLPRVEKLQSYVWRRHLASATSRMLTVDSTGSSVTQQAVCFVDIVGYTSQSKNLTERELVDWLEPFEDAATGLVVDHGGRIIKTIGDEVLFVADDAAAAADVALAMTARGADPEDRLPQVRAGLAYGEVVSRLGDVFGPTVNVAARLTSVARPGTVLVDRGAYEALSGRVGDDESAGPDDEGADSAYSFRRTRRTPVKGYSRLQPWVLRRR